MAILGDCQFFDAGRVVWGAGWTQAHQHLAGGPVTRYELPKLSALNFVTENALGGGVTISLAMDGHGKTLSYVMQDIDLPQ